MSHQPSLDDLLLDILADFESLLKTAKNGPAKRKLTSRIERIKLAIAQSDKRPAAPGSTAAGIARLGD